MTETIQTPEIEGDSPNGMGASNMRWPVTEDPDSGPSPVVAVAIAAVGAAAVLVALKIRERRRAQARAQRVRRMALRAATAVLMASRFATRPVAARPDIAAGLLVESAAVLARRLATAQRQLPAALPMPGRR